MDKGYITYQSFERMNFVDTVLHFFGVFRKMNGSREKVFFSFIEHLLAFMLTFTNCLCSRISTHFAMESLSNHGRQPGVTLMRMHIKMESFQASTQSSKKTRCLFWSLG